MTEDISNDEFCARFKARMLKAGPFFDDGKSIADYADEVAETYWETDWQRELGPEKCAEADMSYWGDPATVAAGLSGVQKTGILQPFPLPPYSICPAPTLLAGPNPVFTLRRRYWLIGPHVWVLTKFGKAVRVHLQNQLKGH